MRNEIRKEVIGIILLALGIISALLLYLPEDITGILGSLVNKTIFGLVGTCAVVVPFFLLYASIDYFVERRTNVARIRVRSLMLILVLVSALLAVITTDFDYFKELCVKDGTDKASAWKSLLLLWKSGANPSLIQNTTITMGVIPGGLIGGIIATSLYVLCGRTVSIITLKAKDSVNTIINCTDGDSITVLTKKNTFGIKVNELPVTLKFHEGTKLIPVKQSDAIVKVIKD